jgi:hypothetical protein
MLLAEAADEQILEVSKRHTAVDGAPCREGDDERIGTPRRPFGAFRGMLDASDPGFEAGQPLIFLGYGLRGRLRHGLNYRWRLARNLDRGDRLRNAEEPRRRLVARQRPGRGRGAEDDERKPD